MSVNVINQAPYLRATRSFPEDIQPLVVEINRSYVDIASKVNDRIIGLFPTNRPAITGEAWFYDKNQRQQTIRQVYLITGAGNIPHNIDLNQIGGFTRIWGTFTNGTNWYPLPYVDVVAANNQVNVIVTPTNIVITAGGGTPPTISSGFVVLEWLTVF